MKIAKNIFLSICVITFAAFFYSCDRPRESGHKKGKNQVLTINIVSEPQALDPRKARSLSDINLVKAFNDGLMRIDQNKNLSFALAQEIQKSSDGKTYTVKLKNAHWSNGDKITAKDFEYSWKQTLSPNFASDNAYQLFVIRNAKPIKEGLLPSNLLGFNVIDEHTFTITLETPVPYFEKLLTLPVFFPVNATIAAKNENWAKNAENYVCSGPFVLSNWKHNDKIVAQKNKKYWDAAQVSLKEITMIMVSEETELNMFEKEEINWVGSPFSNISVDALESFEASQQVETAPALGTIWIRTNVEHPLLSHACVRKALAYAINREEIITHVLHGSKSATTGIVPVAMRISDAPYFKDGDKELAEQLFQKALSELNVKKEDFSNVRLIFKNSLASKKLVEAVQQQWFQNLGITVQLQQLEHKVLFDAIAKRNYELSLESWIADFNDPINFLEIFKTKTTGTNSSNWESPNYFKAINDSYVAATETERAECLKTAEKIFVDEMPVIPVFNYKWVYMKDPKLKNSVLSDEGHLDLKYAHLE